MDPRHPLLRTSPPTGALLGPRTTFLGLLQQTRRTGAFTQQGSPGEVPGAGSLKSVLPACPASEGSGGGSLLPLPASGNGGWSFACDLVPLVSASLLMPLSSVMCGSFPSRKDCGQPDSDRIQPGNPDPLSLPSFVTSARAPDPNKSGSELPGSTLRPRCLTESRCSTFPTGQCGDPAGG